MTRRMLGATALAVAAAAMAAAPARAAFEVPEFSLTPSSTKAGANADVTIVGVNKFVTDQVDDVDILRVDPESEKRQLARLATFKENRDQAAVEAKLEALRDIARGEGNLLHPIRAALAADASIGEVCGAMRDVFGEYRGGAFF